MEDTQDLAEPRKRIVGPSSVLAYQDPKYWDERFSSEEHYEWLKDHSHFRHLLQPHFHSKSSVLELGCGNSQLSDELYKSGITQITCTDLSPVAVQSMQKRFLSKGYKDIKVLEADMLDLPFSDECFDVVIEKGTMLSKKKGLQPAKREYLRDVLFVGSGDPWNPHPTTVSKVMAMLQGVHRVLKPDGMFISISFGQPHFRRPFFEAPEFTWSVEYSTFGDGFHYFFYTLKKGKRSADDGHNKAYQAPSICMFQDELEGEDYLFRTNVEELNGDD